MTLWLKAAYYLTSIECPGIPSHGISLSVSVSLGNLHTRLRDIVSWQANWRCMMKFQSGKMPQEICISQTEIFVRANLSDWFYCWRKILLHYTKEAVTANCSPNWYFLVGIYASRKLMGTLLNPTCPLLNVNALFFLTPNQRKEPILTRFLQEYLLTAPYFLSWSYKWTIADQILPQVPHTGPGDSCTFLPWPQ